MLTENESMNAHSQGWQLCEVYDEQQRRLNLTILPVHFGQHTAEQTLQFVTAQAKARNPLAIKALTLIAQHNIKHGK
jgi:hypothetical protein